MWVSRRMICQAGGIDRVVGPADSKLLINTAALAIDGKIEKHVPSATTAVFE